jgi:two-component system nitrate/nitrite response regulator NarL
MEARLSVTAATHGLKSPPPPHGPLRILIAGSTRFYIDGLALLLERDPAFAVAGVARTASELLAVAAAVAPDVVLLDLGLAASIEHVRELGGAPVVVLAVSEHGPEIVACAEAGGAGFVTRDSSYEELAATVQSAARGELLCSPRIAAVLLGRVGALAAEARAPGPAASPLTARELEIAELIDQRLSNKEIAVRLSIEVATVKNHVHNILEKLQVSRRADAAAHVRRLTRV